MIKKILLIALCLLCIACTSSGGDDDNGSGGNDNGGDNNLSTNACSSLGLSSRSYTRTVNGRIINGTACSENNSPVVEIILTLPDGREGTCTGNMITATDVLTAAHCFFENPVRVVVSASGVNISASRVISHPDVSIDSSGYVYNDAAIIKLSAPAGLPTLPIVASRSPAVGEEIKIFGYGITEDQSLVNNTTGTLRSGEMLISDVDENFVDADFDGDGSNTCSGDSGGPALLELNGQIGIVGLLSTGAILECTTGDTSRFTNTQSQSVLNFITINAPGARFI